MIEDDDETAVSFLLGVAAVAAAGAVATLAATIAVVVAVQRKR